MIHQNNQGSVPSILSKVRLFKGDKVLGVIIPILVVISALVVYSSVAKMGYAHMGTQTNAIFTKHLIVISIAMLTMVGFYFIPAKFLYRIAPYAYAACWFFTLGVYFFGADTNGAARFRLLCAAIGVAESGYNSAYCRKSRQGTANH